MPKETIKSSKPFTTSINVPVPGNPDASFTLKCEDVIHVGWMGVEDGWVQVASLRSQQRLPSEGQGMTSPTGLYVDLDRRGINDLIRALRKARDRTFGSDA